MKNIIRFAIFLLTLTCTFAYQAQAQAPQCLGAGGFVYYLASGGIYNYLPNQPSSATNPTLNTIPFPNGGGLAVSNNLNGVGPSPTFYTTIGGTYWYYNGIAFVNTGHSTGVLAAVNPTGAGPYIYNLVGGSGDIYIYDGTGPSTLAFTVIGFMGGGPFDLMGDCEGNVYILKTEITPAFPQQALYKYNPTGTLLHTWTLLNAPSTFSGGGMAIVDDTLYYLSGGGKKGFMGPNSIDVIPFNQPALAPASDFASCQIGGGSAQASIDTGYYCGSGPGVPVSAIGNPAGTYTWTVVSGNATLSSSTAQNITITATTTSRIRLAATGANVCPGTGFDTVTIVVPTATVEAGSARTINGCGTYFDSLNAIVTGVTPNVTYEYS